MMMRDEMKGTGTGSEAARVREREKERERKRKREHMSEILFFGNLSHCLDAFPGS